MICFHVDADEFCDGSMLVERPQTALKMPFSYAFFVTYLYLDLWYCLYFILKSILVFLPFFADLKRSTFRLLSGKLGS